MLKLAWVLVALASNVALADRWENTKYVCQEYKPGTSVVLPRTVVLTQTGPVGSVFSEEAGYEVTSIPMSLEIIKGTEAFSFESYKGTVETEDVSFQFTSEDKKLSFHIYLDEMDQSTLTVKASNGSEVDSSFVCR